MSTRRYQHTIQVPEDLEKAFDLYKQKHFVLSFNSFVLRLLEQAVVGKTRRTP